MKTRRERPNRAEAQVRSDGTGINKKSKRGARNGRLVFGGF